MSRTLKAAEPGASIELIDGAEVVWQVDSYEDEYRAVREGAALSDLSGAGPLRVAGSDAAAALNAVLTRDVELLVPEQTQASLVLAPDGRPLDAVVVLALAPDEYLVTCGPGRGPTVSEAVRAASPGAEAEIEDLAESMAVFSVEGPESWRAVDAVLGEDFVGLAYGSLLPGEVDGAEILVARIGVTGEYGYTLFLPQPLAPRLWRALARHARPIGRRALETAMLEVRHPLPHRELSADSTVLTAGLNWLVDRTKPEFVGRAVLLALDPAEGMRPLGFRADPGAVAAGEPLFVEGERVGHVVYVVEDPGLGGQLGLAAVDRGWQAAGLEFTAAAGAITRTLAAPYVVPRSWTT
jgi:glycine cleavage system aminomethyltransferase T